jgi:hypothetical protein
MAPHQGQSKVRCGACAVVMRDSRGLGVGCPLNRP